MSYIPPNAVTSPRRHFTLITVLEDGRTGDNPTGEGNVSVALGRWRSADGAEEPILGVRWNGDDANPIGNPQSRGLPTWFVVPRHLRRSILEHLVLSDAKEALVLEAFDDFGAGPDGTGWICDECGKPICKAKDGVVEWPGDKVTHWRGRRMRVVHHFLASPLRKKRGDAGCYQDGPDWEWDSLDHFLGPDGLMQLLALIADKEVPAEDILHTIQRLHLPRFERARPYIDSALADGVFEPNLAPGFYWQRDLELVLAHRRRPVDAGR
jgi:hypothetical protein